MTEAIRIWAKINVFAWVCGLFILTPIIAGLLIFIGLDPSAPEPSGAGEIIARVCFAFVGLQHFAALAVMFVMGFGWVDGPLKMSQAQVRAVAKGLSRMSDAEREELDKTMRKP